MFVMLYVTRIVLQTLGAEDFGIYDVVGGAISMLSFLNTSMANTIQRFLNTAQGRGDQKTQLQIFNIGVVFHIIIALLIVFVLMVMSLFLFNGILNILPSRIYAAKIIYLCLIISTFFNVITVPYDASINAHEDMLTYSIIGIIDIFLKLAIALAIVNTSFDKLILYGILMMIVPIATYAMMKIWCLYKYSECHLSLKKYYDNRIAKEMLSFAGLSFLGTSSNVVGNYGNTIVLNHFFGTTLNAVAGIANQFQGMLLVLSAGMLRALNPIIYKSGCNDLKLMMSYSYAGCKYAFILLSILAIPILIETQFVLEIWLGKIPKWTIIFVRLQLLRCLLEQLTTTLDKSLAAVGKIKEYSIFSFAFNLLPIVFLSVAYAMGLPPYWHFIIAISFMVIFVSVVKVYYCFKYCGLTLRDFAQSVLIPCFVTSFTAIMITSFLSLRIVEGLPKFCFVSIVSAAVIFSMNILFMRKEEKQTALIALNKFIALLKNRL